MADATITVEDADGNEVEVPASTVNDYRRALAEHDGLENLEKAELVFYVASVLEGETPDGHPSDHNGTVGRQRLIQWAQAVADNADEFEA